MPLIMQTIYHIVLSLREAVDTTPSSRAAPAAGNRASCRASGKPWPAWRNAPAKPSICRSVVGLGRPSRNQALGFIMAPMRPRFGKLRGKSLRWQKSFILTCPTSAPRWSGPCAQRWRERSRTRLRAGPGPCCSVARASIEAAPRVAELMARELKRDGDR